MASDVAVAMGASQAALNKADSGHHFETVSFTVPKFKYERGRWSTSRTENVEEIAAHWQDYPEAVRVLQDPKLGRMSMVMLRKDRFEALQKLLNDLQHGQAFIQQDVQTLLDALVATKELVELKNKETGNLAPLEKQLNVLLRISSRIESTILVKSSSTTVEPTSLTQEELSDIGDE